MSFLNKITKNGKTFDLQDKRITDTTAADKNTFLHVNNTGSIEWAIPQLSELADDDNHRTVTDNEKSVWNEKQDAIDDLTIIKEGAALGATAVQPATLNQYYTSVQTDTAIANAIGVAIGSSY